MEEAMATAVEPTVDNEIKTEALALIEQARAIKVTNAAEYQQACDFGRELAGRIKRAEIYFENLIEPARTAWKRLTTARDAILTPMEQAKKHVSQLAANWQLEERKRAEAEAEQERIKAVRAEEDRRLQAAEALAAEGRQAEAEQLLVEEAIPMPIVANVSQNVPKVSGVSTARLYFGIEVTSLKLLVEAAAAGKIPLECLKADESFLKKQAAAFKGKLAYPGVRVTQTAGTSFRS